MDDSIRSVLKLLEEGKISASEAERLINELNKTKKDGFSKKMQQIGKNIDEMADELNYKFDELSQEYSPKVKKAVKDVGKKTSELLKDLSDELDKIFK